MCTSYEVNVEVFTAVCTFEGMYALVEALIYLIQLEVFHMVSYSLLIFIYLKSNFRDYCILDRLNNHLLFQNK